MFLDELDQRAGRLSTAANTLALGDIEKIDFRLVCREAHTIKGTARVMGYVAVGAGAAVLEAAWDEIAAGSVPAGHDLGEALEAVAVALHSAGDESPRDGTVELTEALERLTGLVQGLEMPDMPFTAEPGETVDPDPAQPQATSRASAGFEDGDSMVLPTFPRPPGARPESGEATGAADDRETPKGSSVGLVEAPEPQRLEVPEAYAGLIGAVEDWAGDGTVIVNIGRLYTLINRVAETRSGAADLVELVVEEAPDKEEMRSTAWGVAMATEALPTEVLGLASLPLSALTGPLPQLVSYLGKKLGKDIDLQVSGDTTRLVDRHVLEALAEPVRQLIVNAVYHGLETPAKRKMERKPALGLLTVNLLVNGNMLELVVADDGAGVDWNRVHASGVDIGLITKETPINEEALEPLLFEPGLSTGSIDRGHGQGQGLTKLADAVEHLHGRIQLKTWPGDGTRISIRLPAWQSLQKMSIVRSGGLRWAIPEAAVEHSMPTDDAGGRPGGDILEMDWNGRLIPLVSFAEAAGIPGAEDGDVTMVLSHRVGAAAFTVEEVEASRDLAVTDITSVGDAPDHVSGVVLLGFGEVALVIDAGRLIEGIRLIPAEDRRRARVLVFDDSGVGRGVLSRSLSSSGFTTSLASTVGDTLDLLAELPIDAVVVDFGSPTASGIALVEEIRRRDPRMPILMLSDVASEDDRTRAKLAGVDRFFHKSEFRGGALVTALWELLDA